MITRARQAHRRDRLAIAVLAILWATVLAAAAQTDSTSMTSSALVIGRAEIIGVSGINFVDYDPTSSTPNDAVGGVTVRATKGLDFAIYIGADRQMTDGSGNALDYELYDDPARTSVWGATATDGVAVTSTGNAPAIFSIFGRIPALQDVPAGQFSDTVTVTVEW